MQIPEAYCAAFHQSANRPKLLVGCEPTAISLIFIICIIGGFSVPTWWGVACAAFLFLFLREMLREMAKQDAILLTVHHESQRYNQGFWTAKPRRVKRWRA
jgi:type IV secretory pathway TrbD component